MYNNVTLTKFSEAAVVDENTTIFSQFCNISRKVALCIKCAVKYQHSLKG